MVVLLFAVQRHYPIRSMPVPSSRHRARTHHRLGRVQAAAMLKKEWLVTQCRNAMCRNASGHDSCGKKPGGALNNAPDNDRNLATLMLKGNCNIKKP
jgi:hypothetical protein